MAKVDRGIDGSADAVYAAEEHVKLLLFAMDQAGVKIHQAYGSSFTMPVERTFLTRKAVEDYLNHLNGIPKLRAMADKPRNYIEVRKSRYADRTGMLMNVNEAIVYLSDVDDGGVWREYRQLFVLHEFAHYLGGGSGHGKKFRAAYLELVKEEMGPELATYLGIRIHEESEEVKKLKKGQQ